MIVIITSEIFSSDKTNPLDLYALFRLGTLEGSPHLILTDPIYSESDREAKEVNDWLNRQEKKVGQLCKEILDNGISLHSEINPLASPVTLKIETVNQPVWDRANQRHVLPLDKAVKLLSSPFTIWVENRRNDKAFLEAVATGWRKERLKKLLANAFMEFNGGGGLGEVLKWVEEIADLPEKRHRSFALFDSDAPQPKRPSQQSQEVVETCQKTSIPYHQLQRRAIENYLSLESLAMWATRKVHEPVHGKNKHQLVEEFKNLANAQRYHLDMKKHFVPTIAELFKTEYPKIQESRLRKDTDLMQEINQVLDKLLSLV